MTYAAERGAIEYEAESTWGENVSTFATHRLPVLGPIDISGLTEAKLEPQYLQQRLQEGSPYITGPQGGSFRTRFWVPGHGSATSGAMSASALATLLSYVLGKLTVGPTGTTFTGGTATTPTTTSSGTFPAGGLGRAGAGGLSADGRGNGAWFAIDEHDGNDLELLVGLDDAPDNADVCHSAEMLYLPEDVDDEDAELTGLRFRFLTAGWIVETHGCWARSITITGTQAAGEVLQVEVEWGVSWWKYTASGTYPSAVTSTQHQPAPTAGGGFFVAAAGTATRANNQPTISSFTVEVTLGVAERTGFGGVNPLQTVVGAVRTPSTIRVRWVEDMDGSPTATPRLPTYHESASFYHALLESSRVPGKAVAFYFRRLCPSGPKPVPFNDGGIWRIAIEMMAHTGTDDTSALTLAAMVIGLA